MLWKTFDMPDNGVRLADMVAVRFGTTPRLIPSAFCFTSVLETTTPHPQLWKLVKTQLPRRSAPHRMTTSTASMALDLKTGQIKWADGLQAFDTFVGLCTMFMRFSVPINPS
jgi:hypothetical protein